jgi:hypothetical protein
MARFPQTESEVAALAQLMIQGFIMGAVDFPDPPVSPEEMQQQLDAFNASAGAVALLDTQYKEGHGIKDKHHAALVESMKVNLRYAELASRGRPEKLSQLGWGPRRNGNSLKAPGEVRDIRIRTEGDNWLILEWKAPVDGGVPQAYVIERRRRNNGSWEDAGTTMDTAHLLSNQPRGEELEYRVVARNRSGTGQPGATVQVVL